VSLKLVGAWLEGALNHMEGGFKH